MDERAALKYIFKDIIFEDENVLKITYNGNKYIIDDETRKIDAFKTSYGYILDKETHYSNIKNDLSKEIESDYNEVKKITEEEFFQYFEMHRKPRVESVGMSGKEIWLAKKFGEDFE